MTTQPFYAVRVVLYHADGSSSQRDYVRGDQHMGRAAFAAFALGDMLLLTDSHHDVSWTVTEVDFETVRQNRLYHHTTH